MYWMHTCIPISRLRCGKNIAAQSAGSVRKSVEASEVGSNCPRFRIRCPMPFERPRCSHEGRRLSHRRPPYELRKYRCNRSSRWGAWFPRAHFNGKVSDTGGSREGTELVPGIAATTAPRKTYGCDFPVSPSPYERSR